MKTKKGTKVRLPTSIRNELQIVCAMRGYSHIKGGKGKTLMQQYDALYTYYHGKQPSRPSQIEILCEGTLKYSDLYDSVIKPTTSKTNEKITELVLKKTFHCDATRRLCSGKDIIILT